MNPGRRPLLTPLAVLVLAAFAAAQARDRLKLTFLHTNDEHGQVTPYRLTAENESAPPLAGGAVMLARAVDRYRTEEPELLLLSAGDWFQGTPHGTLSNGSIVTSVMNAVGYDVVVPGNHEFDFGEAIPRAMARNGLFRVVAANVVGPDRTTPRPWLQPFTIVTMRGVRVGVSGLLTEDTPSLVVPGRMGDTTVLAEIPAAEHAVREMRRAGAEVVVFVNHIGADQNAKIAAAVPGIDLMIGGHIHSSVLYEGRRAADGKTLIAQSGANTRSLGYVELEFDPVARAVVGGKARVERLAFDPSARHAAIDAILEREGGEITRMMEAPVGDWTPDRSIRKNGSRDASSPLGNWMADILRETTGADLAFMNEGGIRIDLPPERIRLKHIWELMPFDNTVVVLDVTGAQILEALELSLGKATSGLELSGIDVEVAGRVADGSLELRARIDGRPVEKDRVYRLGTNSFLGEGQDGYPVFKNVKAKKDDGVLLREALKRAIEKRLLPSSTAEERWKRLPKTVRLGRRNHDESIAA